MGTRFISAAVCAFALVGGSVKAATVLVTNDTSGWTVTRSTSTATSGAYNGVTYSVDPSINNLPVVDVSILNPLWTAQNNLTLFGDHAKWVSSNPLSGMGSIDPMFTKYVYNGSFAVANVSQLLVTFAADNFVDNVVLSTQANGGGTVLDTWTNTTTPLGSPTSGNGKVWGFLLQNVQNTLTSGSGTIFISATTYNYDTGSNAPFLPGPNGFIMAVDATTGGTNPPPVPLPAAVWGGLSLLGGLGVARLRRRK
jgi:hypothetical protein